MVLLFVDYIRSKSQPPSLESQTLLLLETKPPSKDTAIMDLDALPDDFFVTTSQFTKTAYRDEYPDLDPASEALSQEGKIVVITGTSQGIGRYVRATSSDTHQILADIRTRVSLQPSQRLIPRQ